MGFHNHKAGWMRITERSGPSYAGVGQLLLIGFSILALYAFLQDYMNPDWRAWILSPLLLVGFRAAVSATTEGSLARAALWQGALVVIPFTGVYGLLDLIFSSDGPVWLLTPVIVLGLWFAFSLVVDAESD